MKETSIMHSSVLLKVCDKDERLNGSNLKVSDGSELGEYLIDWRRKSLAPIAKNGPLGL
jgi:hypothetical protein